MKTFIAGLLLGLVLSSLLFAAPLVSIDLQTTANANRVMAAFCTVYNRPDKVPDATWKPTGSQTEMNRPLIDNPQSKAMLARIAELEPKAVSVVTPDLAASLAAVQAYLERRHLSADEAKAASTPAATSAKQE